MSTPTTAPRTPAWLLRTCAEQTDELLRANELLTIAAWEKTASELPRFITEVAQRVLDAPLVIWCPPDLSRPASASTANGIAAGADGQTSVELIWAGRDTQARLLAASLPAEAAAWIAQPARVYLDDLSGRTVDEPTAAGAARTVAMLLGAGDLPLRSCAILPVAPPSAQSLPGEQHRGILFAYFSASAAVAPESRWLLDGFARLAGLAIGSLEARVQERQRLLDDLHDTAKSKLTALRLQIATLLKRRRRPPDFSDLEDLDATAAQVDAEMRVLFEESAQRTIDRAALVRLLNRELRQTPTLTVQSHVGQPLPDLPSALVNEIMHTVREAVINAAKYGMATVSWISIFVTDDVLHIRASNNGRSFYQQTQGGYRGFGLLNMQKRATRLGGSFQVRGGAEVGATIELTVPLDKGGKPDA